MNVEGVKLIAGWLGDATWGVNALLPTVPRYAAHDQPPDVTAIENEFEDDPVALRTVPETLTGPRIWVFQFDHILLQAGVTTEFRAGEMPTVIGYIHQKSETAKGLRDASYTLRAIEWSLAALQRQGSSSKTANNVGLTNFRQPFERVPPFVPLESGRLTSGLIVRVVLRDLQAQP